MQRSVIDLPKYMNLSQEKLQGAVSTPEWIVNLMLDRVGYIDNLDKKSIIDPACGDGNFLVVVLDRLLNYLEKHNFSDAEKVEAIERNIFGIDIDGNAIKKCNESLNKILEKHEIKQKTKFNLYKRDALDVEKK